MSAESNVPTSPSPNQHAPIRNGHTETANAITREVKQAGGL